MQWHAGHSGTHDTPLVLLSLLIAMITGITALRLVEQAGRGFRHRIAWFVGAALAMGMGTWAMHFVAMLAYKAPVHLTYDGPLTLFSLAVAIFGAICTFLFLRDRAANWMGLTLSGTMMGLNTVVMHYLGMAAIRLPGRIEYDPVYVVLSVLIAVGSSCLSVFLAFGRLAEVMTRQPVKRLLGGTGVGLSIAAMHFSAMKGTHFEVIPTLAEHSLVVVQSWLGLVIGVGTMGLMGLASLASSIDQRGYRQMTSTLESMGDAIAFLDREWRYTYLNESSARLLHRTREELLGESIWEMFPMLRGTRFEREFRKAMEEQVQVSFIEYFAPVECWFAVNVYPSVEGLSIYYRDVTTDVRFRSLQENLVANVSHELRAPLATVSAMLEAVKDNVVPESHRPRYFQAMMGEMERLRRLTQDLLELSQLDAGVLNLVRDDIGLLPLFEEVEEIWSPRFLAAEVRFEVVPCQYRVIADYDRVRQVLANLLDNALKFTPQGGWVLLSAEPVGDQIAIRVADSGPGVAREHLPLIWERFHMADTARTRSRSNGAGLGLSLVKHLVQQMGGSVSVLSEPGRGSVFSFTLPSAGADSQVS